jgi:N-acetylmuramate 1-kinase
MPALWPGWAAMSDRKALSAAFLRTHGWGNATRSFLAGDASDRSYDRLIRGADRAVLMDAPLGKGDDPATFVAVAAHLRGTGLSVPEIRAKDLRHGFLLLEDFGDAVFARVLEAEPHLEPALYAAAVDAMLLLQSAPPMPALPDLSASDWATAAMMAPEWYARGITGQEIDLAPLRDTLVALMTRFADGPRVMIHRDYHAENLIWLPDRSGVRRAGVLDFQLLQMGQPAYDLVSLLQDARRDLAPNTATRMRRRFLEATGLPASDFDKAYAVIGAQRAMRIVGIFARLCLVSGKAHYLSMIPRVWRHLQTNLAHPALADLRVACDRCLPEPSPANLSVLNERCGTIRA